MNEILLCVLSGDSLITDQTFPLVLFIVLYKVHLAVVPVSPNMTKS